MFLEIISLALGIIWLGMGVYESKINGLFRAHGHEQYRHILMGTGYAVAGILALYASTLEQASALITLALAIVIFAGAWGLTRILHTGKNKHDLPSGE